MRFLKENIDLKQFFEKVRFGSLLMLDYDGTLAPFVEDRMKAYPYSGINERLAALVRLKTTYVVIISGRRLEDLEKLLQLPDGIELWGSHGLEKKLSNGQTTTISMSPSLAEGIKLGIDICHNKIDPKYYEAKPYGVALHWRGVTPAKRIEMENKVIGLWEKICEKGLLEIHQFDGGVELRPKGIGKGDAVNQIISEQGKTVAVAYLGDDQTDEEAFAALGERGLKILVRKEVRPSLADVQLVPPDDLLVFLDRWIGD